MCKRGLSLSVTKSRAHFFFETADCRDVRLCTMFHVHIVRTGGSKKFSLSYGGSKRGGGFEIACAHFSSEMADHRDLKLYTMLHYH
jgi:hypothetical protein